MNMTCCKEEHLNKNKIKYKSQVTGEELIKSGGILTPLCRAMPYYHY